MGGWACTQISAEHSACLCELSEPRCGDGVDSDCDGEPDGCMICDGVEIGADDERHCGGCGLACPTGTHCLDSACRCDDLSRTLCGGVCVDTMTDLTSCGACGSACPVGAVACRDGRCECGTGELACDGACVPVGSSTEHCGACGAACAVGASCVEGACVCPPGQAACGGACVDVTSDAERCGACDVRCAVGASCSEGACGCPDGQTECAGVCVSTESDDANCGGCGVSCPAGGRCLDAACRCDGALALCGGACVDTTSDVLHCGDCGAACPLRASCTAGACVCPGAETDCGSACADLSSSPAHCGACDSPCAGRCIDGHCVDPIDVGVGADFSCALMRSGEVFCWGASRTGRLGRNETAIFSPYPAPVLGITDAARLAVGYGGSCVVNRSGAVYCWGDVNDMLGPVVDPWVPRELMLPRAAIDVGVGHHHLCVVLDDGDAGCFGRNDYGALGRGGGSSSSWYASVGGAARYNRISAGEQHTCAVDSLGGVWCWGRNDMGQLGIASRPTQTSVPTRLVGPSGTRDVELGRNHSCAITTGGDIWVWGNNISGQLGTRAPIRGWEPASIGSEIPALARTFGDLGVSVGETTCAVNRSTFALRCWGANSYGQVGDGSTTSRGTPTVVMGLSNVARAVVGPDHSCALRRDGRIWCWGASYLGAVGAGATDPERQLTPVEVLF